MCVTFLIVVLSVIFFWAMGFSLNITKSMPRGLYRLSENFDPYNLQGKIISFCPDQDKPIIKIAAERKYLKTSGLCPENIKLVLKIVVGIPGDHIRTGTNVAINGELIPFSNIRETDSMGRKMPGITPRNIILGRDEYWVMAPGINSFDSRYFGSIRLNQIIGVSQPVWLFEDWRETDEPGT